MAIYKYVGRTRTGKMKRGTVDAVNKTQAVAKLREQGIRPREIEEAKGWLYKEIHIGTPVKPEHFLVFCRQFATLIRAGVTVVESTTILAKQTESKALSKLLVAVEEDIRKGNPFSTAAAKYPKVFPSLFINMVRAGEASGNLDGTLDRLATYYEKQYDLKKKVQSSLAYPLTVLVVIVAVTVFIMLVVVPSFTDLFAQFGGELPAITQFVIGVSEGIKRWWWAGIAGVLLFFVLFLFFLNSSYAFRYGVHSMLLKMPVFGKLIQKAAIARMSRTLSSLYGSSVPILESLSIVERVVENPVIGKVIGEARKSLERGNRLSQPFQESWVIPPLVTHMVAIGEETGTLDFMLTKIADFYEAEVDRTADGLKALIEPILIILLAGVVSIIILSVMVPMFTLFRQMG